jgi:DnaJ-class molecular chaperone
MLFRKLNVFTPSYSVLQNLSSSPTKSSTSCRHPSQCVQQQRQYARVVGDESSQFKEQSNERDEQYDPIWPEPIPPRTAPTPYQILNLAQEGTYTKTHFYKLAKIYHPDRTQHEHLCPSNVRKVPHAVRLERYRLIIAAHAILSDPVKRQAYDTVGAGWTGSSGTCTTDRKWYYGAHQKWAAGEGPMYNATWEDWER